MSTLIGIIAFLGVVGWLGHRHNKKVIAMQEANTQTIVHNIRLIAQSEKLVLEYQILISVLKDHFTEEEIQRMFEEKLIQKREEQRYDG